MQTQNVRKVTSKKELMTYGLMPKVIQCSMFPEVINNIQRDISYLEEIKNVQWK